MKKRNIYISLERDNGQIIIKIKAPQELEDFFKKVSNGEIQISTYWKNEAGEAQQFYKISEEYKEAIKKVLGEEDKDYIDNYGNGLIKVDNSRFPYTRYNIAILRTKGISDGFICLKSEKFESISNLELEDYIRFLGRTTKKLWEILINKTTIKSKITFEI